MRTRKHPKDRKDEIFEIAVELSEQVGVSRITRAEIALRANVSKGLISHYFNTMQDLKEAIIKKAFETNNAKIAVHSSYNFKD